jgi:hypothetical protein
MLLVFSPPAMPPSDEPTSSEIAEVTLIHVCRELAQKPKYQFAVQTRVKSCLR